MHRGRALAVALLATCALACQSAAASADQAGAFLPGGLGPAGALGLNTAVPIGACNSGDAGGQGSGGIADPHNCLGSGLVFNGPMIGQIATIIGPTVIGPAVVTVVQAGGSVGAGG